jgi:hypothetical protein
VEATDSRGLQHAARAMSVYTPTIGGQAASLLQYQQGPKDLGASVAALLGLGLPPARQDIRVLLCQITFGNASRFHFLLFLQVQTVH